MQLNLEVRQLAELLFPSVEITLEAEREWAARNITDYHVSECRVIDSALAYAIKESDPEATVFHVQITGPNNKTFILWRSHAWLNSTHRKLEIRRKLSEEKRVADEFRTANLEEIAYRKQVAEWLDRVALQFCELSLGYKVTFLRQTFRRLALAAKYDVELLYATLITMIEEEILSQVWIAPPQRKHEQTKQEEVQPVSEVGAPSGQASREEGKANGEDQHVD